METKQHPEPMKTLLWGEHARLGAKFVDFHGWLMPLQYSDSIVSEHNIVRSLAGLFDVSHMGEFLMVGDKSLDSIQRLVTNDASKLSDGDCMYTPMCLENGGIVDDLLVYRKNSREFMLVVNASNIRKDYDWIQRNISGGVVLKDMSDTTGMLALQGPKAEEILQKVTDYTLQNIKHFKFKENVSLNGVPALVSRTGYTGEDGFEIYFEGRHSSKVWNSLLTAGAKPAGLGTRDSLRLEAGLMLYGNDIDETTNPLEAPLGWTVKFDKKDFIGRGALIRQKESGVLKKLVGFEMLERCVPRQGYDLADGDTKIGRITSGIFSPTLEKGIGLGYVKTKYAHEGAEIGVEIRGKKYKAKTVKIPFIKKL